jgi:hypothetical protein
LNVLDELLVLELSLRIDLRVTTFIGFTVFNHAKDLLARLLFVLGDLFGCGFFGVNLLEFLFVEVVCSLRELFVNFVRND